MQIVRGASAAAAVVEHTSEPMRDASHDISNDDLRVVQLGPFAPPHGGVRANLIAIREFLRRRNIPCAVINLTKHRQAPAEQVYYPRHALQLLWLLIRRRYDIIHLHVGGNVAPRLLALGIVCRLIPRARTVLTLHSGGYPSSPAGRSTKRRSWRGFALRQFDRLIGVNAELLDFYHRLGCPPERTRLISPHAFSPPDEWTLADAEQRCPSAFQQFRATHRPLLLTVGQLEPEYDLSFQIDALAAIRKNHPDAGLAIIGAGSLEADIRRYANASGSGEHVLLCGDVAHEATLAAIVTSDVLLRTTRYDGDSIAVREAIHLGTPVIATNNGMRPRGVRLFPPGDLEAFQEAVDGVLAVPARGRSQPVRDERNLEAVLALYGELVG